MTEEVKGEEQPTSASGQVNARKSPHDKLKDEQPVGSQKRGTEKQESEVHRERGMNTE